MKSDDGYPKRFRDWWDIRVTKKDLTTTVILAVLWFVEFFVPVGPLWQTKYVPSLWHIPLWWVSKLSIGLVAAVILVWYVLDKTSKSAAGPS